jgi:hypothetical protein
MFVVLLLKAAPCYVAMVVFIIDTTAVQKHDDSKHCEMEMSKKAVN